MPSQYYPKLDQETKSIILDDQEFHHLARVKRLTTDQEILINGGNGYLATARISRLEKQSAFLEVLSIEYHEMLRPRFAIAFALLKSHHDELALEKCTELGALDFFPLKTRFTVREEGKNTRSRFESIALAAIKQCDNPWLPTVHPASDLKAALAEIRKSGYTPVLCSEREESHWLQDLDYGPDLCFVIGPEGGFSEEEFALLKDLPHIRLSHLITRAETAAIAISAQFQAYRKSGTVRNSVI
ncbi:MAG: 16S rRNA (uracil(1498)-N(3))-methyltransferase [Candidatus Cloacimonetes bacterium]|jgi:16S rRNA (uracil1498-N3)-methyltransferase|nr:16S rRNA (uracil(1498)-N(3))-methyltransferase [Candidatus Cloacimonadota bacterium]MCB5287530.1 16S rRNA (uracil(1498)-N(3))-methyltransferase [Candidatus Cloacimonadota bacterium]MCK9183754.1 16S rRNA (uracil(1498)-N(3))-methyltransferase [Candidatus Cloacimonadota bacterium]MCK9583463.1 16S rRNA (uracil(1498)-N(3))-methyltransferase [Candidatus Cloacimonadota bacterium]MDY0229851.1 RsmE family RNA methyltransferase [Candidatus Cloacimonadaceae bacterium]